MKRSRNLWLSRIDMQDGAVQLPLVGVSGCATGDGCVAEIEMVCHITSSIISYRKDWNAGN